MSQRHAFYDEASDDGGDGYYYGEEDDEPSSLTKASFVIPCTERKKQTNGVAGSSSAAASSSRLLPRLDRFERTDRARAARTVAYHEQRTQLYQALQSTCDAIFSPLKEQLKPFLHGEQGRDDALFYIPGAHSGGSHRLPVTVLLGPHISSSSLHKRLQGWAKDEEIGNRAHLITLSARECASVGQVLRIVTARAGAAMGDKEQQQHVVVRLLNTERISASIINDTLQALHSLNSEADDAGAPKYSILLDAASGPASLDEKLFPETMPIVDLQRVSICKSPVRAFETFIEELFLKNLPNDAVQVVPNGATLGALRRLYFERSNSLDDVVRAMEVGLWDHFASVPETAYLATTLKPTREDLTDDAISRVRETYCSDDSDLSRMLIAIQRRVKQDRASALQYLQNILSDDRALIRHLLSIRAYERDRALRFRALCTLVFSIRRWLSGGTALDATASDSLADQHYFSGPRAAELGGITFALLSGKTVQSLLHDLPITLRRRALSDLETLWDRLQELDTLRLSDKHVAVTAAFEKVLDQAASAEENEQVAAQPEPASANDEQATTEEAQAAAQEQKRLEKVQRQLQREENAATIKKEVAEAILNCLEDIVPPRDQTEKTMFVMSNSPYLDMLLNPAPRANVVAALHDPKAYLEAAANGKDSEESEASSQRITPDISHAFTTYSDAGRLINLADWYTAFVQSIEAEGRAQNKPSINGTGSARNATSPLPSTPRKRRRLDAGEDEREEEEDEEEDNGSDEEMLGPNGSAHATAAPTPVWRRPTDDMLQVRFALAVHELGRMGFLKRTRRKRDHVLKLVYDLPPAKVPAAGAGTANARP